MISGFPIPSFTRQSPFPVSTLIPVLPTPFFSRPQGIMLQIFIIILFRFSSKIVSLCSSLFPKYTDYSFYSQLYCHILQVFLHFCNQNVQQCFVVAYTIKSASVIAYYNCCYCSQVLSNQCMRL